MFEWFRNLAPGSSSGLASMTSEFGQMLDAGRHIFATAANALLGGTDPEVIRNELFETDEAINRAEQKIRREVVVHTSVHGTNTLPVSLVLMSVVKDAERIGDYAKNLFDLAATAPPLPHDAYREDLLALKDKVSKLLREVRQVFDSQDEEAARDLSQRLAAVEDHCDQQVAALLKAQDTHPAPATLVLVYRYFKRVVAHSRNVTSSIFMPVDKLDYFDEPGRKC